MPNTQNTEHCPTCGNVLPSSDAACTRCNAKYETAAVAEPLASEMAKKGVFRDWLARKRAPVDSPYPNLPETETMVPVSKSKAGRRLKFAGIVTAGLIGLLAGASYLNHGLRSYRQETKLAAEPIAPNGIPRPGLQGAADSPAGTKSASVDILGTLDAARLAMVHGELSAARARLAALPSGQDQRIDIRQVTNELIQRELARDAALGLARACEKAGDMPCVLRAAGDALASDVSDSEAREMLLHAVARTGLTPGPGLKVNRPADPPKATHRRSSDSLHARHESQALANNTDVYAKH